MKRSLAALGVRDFRRLAAAYAVNELGDWMGDVALAILVFGVTGSPLATAGLFVCAKFLPALLAPALVARIDHVPIARALPTLYLAEAAAFAVLAVLAGYAFSLSALLALVLLDGTLAIASRTLARTACVGVLEPTGKLREGNAVLNFAYAGGAVGGGALAGWVAGTFGADVALALDAGGFVLSAAAVARLRDTPVAGEREPWRARLRAGLAYARSDRRLRTLLSAEALALVFFALVVPIQIVYARVSLHSDGLGYGALLTAWGAGAIAGSLLYAGLSHRSLLLLLGASSAAVGATYLGMAGAGSLLVACLWCVLGGLGNGVHVVAITTAVQEAVPADLQSRVMGLLQSIFTAMPGVGYLLGGALTAAAGSPRVAYLVAGLGVTAILAGATVALALARARPAVTDHMSTQG